MPDNNRKILSEKIIYDLEDKYNFIYDKENNLIITCINGTKKQTPHKADESFSINVKTLNKKITFNKNTLNIWKEFQNNPKLSKYSLFKINNAVSKLRIMYQEPNSKNVASMLKKEN